MISYQEEQFLDCIREAIPLLLDHWEEIASHKDVRPLDPDFDTYAQAAKLGSFRCFTARRDGKLVGYAAFLIHHNLHYKSWVEAHNDIYYLAPDERKGSAGFKFFRACEEWLKAIPVRAIYFPDKVRTSKAKLFQRLGYVGMETKFEKVL